MTIAGHFYIIYDKISVKSAHAETHPSLEHEDLISVDGDSIESCRAGVWWLIAPGCRSG